MALINSLLATLQADFPHIYFVPSDHFRWSPSQKSIFYPTDNTFSQAELFHELGHALRGHQRYGQDIQLISMEREAWETAQHLGQQYRVKIASEHIEINMETYREWLYRRSLCPDCQQSGLQTKTGTYQCLNCRCQWRANEARSCLLRRQVLKQPR